MLDLESLLGGISVISALAVIGALIFAESAFLFGLFVPGGDTLLIIAGVLAAQGSLPLYGVLAVIFIAAVLGDNVGYYIGEKTGPKVFAKRRGVFFNKQYVDRAERFYQRYGGATVVIARFVAYVRTFVPLIAGVAHMPRAKFVFYNVFGALFWTLSLVLIGYWLGKEFAEQIERYILPAALAGMVLLFGPSVVYLVRNPRVRAAVASRFRLFGRLFRR